MRGPTSQTVARRRIANMMISPAIAPHACPTTKVLSSVTRNLPRGWGMAQSHYCSAGLSRQKPSDTDDLVLSCTFIMRIGSKLSCLSSEARAYVSTWWQRSDPRLLMSLERSFSAGPIEPWAPSDIPMGHRWRTHSWGLWPETRGSTGWGTGRKQVQKGIMVKKKQLGNCCKN